MAGFLQNISDRGVFSTIKNAARNISNFGMNYEDMIVKNSQAIGQTEAGMLKRSGMLNNDAFYHILSAQDTKIRKYIAYFDQDYKSKVNFLRKFSINGEIDFILDILADESIVNDEKNFCCYPLLNNMEVSDEVRDNFEQNFRKIYLMFGFQNGINAWQYYKQFLIDGFLAFEIIYNDDASKIIGFKELAAETLSPDIEHSPDGGYKQIWIQNPDDAKKRRVLYDSQIIYISYANGNQATRVSYVERLIRSYNILRIMEHTRVIWNVMNSSFRMKMVIPVGTQSPQKANETIGQLLSFYKEEINLNSDSGELTINGRPKLQFYKNFLFPDKNGESPTIEKLNSNGPDFNIMENVIYFYNKLKMDSKIPYARFSFQNGGSSPLALTAESLDRDEIRFSKFISRMRSVFQEVLVKPLYIQTVLDNPNLKDDPIFKTQIGLRFIKDNDFGVFKDLELLTRESDFIKGLSEIKEGEDDTSESFFDPDFLINRFLSLSPDDIKLNKLYKKIDEKSGNSKKDKPEDSGDEPSEPSFKL